MVQKTIQYNVNINGGRIRIFHDTIINNITIKMKYIVSSYDYVQSTIPSSWKDAVYIHPSNITAPIDVLNDQYFVGNDAGLVNISL